MNKALVDNWNALVKPEDTIFHLGDVAMGNKSYLEIIRELNGHKVLIKGNHDRSTATMLNYFNEVFSELTQVWDGKSVLLKHKPMIGYFPQWRQICGHVHDRWTFRGKILNVGVDVWDFKPVHIDQVSAMFNSMTDEEYHPIMPIDGVYSNLNNSTDSDNSIRS